MNTKYKGLRFKKGNFEIREITILNAPNRYRTNLDLEIVKYTNTENIEESTTLSICRVNREGDIISIWDRVLMKIEAQEELDDIKYLVKILQLLMKTDEITYIKDKSEGVK